MKIAITGPESSGKTVLAIQLAAHFETIYTPEFARFWLQEFGPSYDLESLHTMILGQRSWEENSERFTFSPQSGGCEELLYFTDSDPTVFEVWMNVRFGVSSRLVEEWFNEKPADLTLLCHPDLHWTYDPLRENRSDRYDLFTRYKASLESRRVRFAEIRGVGSERLNCAIESVDAYRKGRYRDPY